MPSRIEIESNVKARHRRGAGMSILLVRVDSDVDIIGFAPKEQHIYSTIVSRMNALLVSIVYYAMSKTPTMKKPKETTDDLKKRTRDIIRKLKRTYPTAKCSLNHSNAFELLIATILSAQCTDERVNIVTADLFRKYRKPEDYLKVSPHELERDIQSTGFFRNKTKSIQGASKMLIEEYGGEVPKTMDELLELPGVARKTANVVLGNAFDIKAGVVVDTHVTRLSHRLDLSQEKTAEKIEQDLIPIVPRKDWVIFPHLIIYHGRRICKARNPLCDECEIEKFCPSSFLKTGVPPGL
jgi:endonuclease-3